MTINKSDEQFLWDIANKVEELLVNQANRKVFEQYADEFHKEWTSNKETLLQWGKKAGECLEKASKDKRWRDEEAGPPETGYEWDYANCCWLPPSPILHTLRLKVGHGGIVPRDATENLKRSYLWLIIIHDAKLQKCFPPIDKNSEPLAGHIGIIEGNLAVRNEHVLLSSETYSGHRLIETAFEEVKAELATPKQNESQSAKGTKYWFKFVCKVIAGIGILLGILWTAIQIYESATFKQLVVSRHKSQSIYDPNAQTESNDITISSKTNHDMSNSLPDLDLLPPESPNQ
jgi:hypothetical protein